MENIRHLKSSERLSYHLDNIENRQLLAELVDDADVIIHLAAAVALSSSSKVPYAPSKPTSTARSSSSKPPAKTQARAHRVHLRGLRQNLNVPSMKTPTSSSPHHQGR